jgi:hypothetical protein
MLGTLNVLWVLEVANVADNIVICHSWEPSSKSISKPACSLFPTMSSSI